MDKHTPGPWQKWYLRRPPNECGSYRFRVSPREILGKVMAPEWTAKMFLCGMGYDESEWWPDFSHWDGYRRSVDASLEWRELSDIEDPKDDALIFNGLDLLPCPFTGKPPKIVQLSQWIGAPPYQLEWIGVRSAFVNSLGWRDANALAAAWNTRSPSQAPAAASTEATGKAS